MTKDEYNKTLTRIYDSMRDGKYRGRIGCDGINCTDCLLRSFCYNDHKHRSAYDLMAFVEQWAKEHPIATRVDKFKEVFGAFPVYDGHYCCPRRIGASADCALWGCCEDCERNFWESEYIEPKEENKNV